MGTLCQDQRLYPPWSVEVKNNALLLVQAPSNLGCCPFLGGCSVIVDLLFYVPPFVLLERCVCLCFGVYYFVNVLVLQSS